MKPASNETNGRTGQTMPSSGQSPGFARWPAIVVRDGRIGPRVIPGRLVMNRRGQWVRPVHA